MQMNMILRRLVVVFQQQQQQQSLCHFLINQCRPPYTAFTDDTEKSAFFTLPLGKAA